MDFLNIANNQIQYINEKIKSTHKLLYSNIYLSEEERKNRNKKQNINPSSLLDICISKHSYPSGIEEINDTIKKMRECYKCKRKYSILYSFLYDRYEYAFGDTHERIARESLLCCYCFYKI